MELIPTFEYARTHGVITMDSDFTGVQIIRDMDRKTVGTYHYAGGHLSITHNARVAEDYCEIRYKQRFHTHCSETASATAYAKDVYWNWTSFDGPVPQSPVPTGNPAGVNPWIECEDWVGEGFPEILSSTCSETTSPTPPGTPGTGGNGGYGQPWVGDQMTPQNFLQNYVLLGPKNPIDPSQKLDCFDTIPSDPKYKYSITLYVDQPYANTRKIANFSLEYNVERRPGHTYFGLERYDSSSGEIIRVVMGFYVQNSLTAMTGVYTGGAWGDDGGTDYDVSLKVDDITASDFKDIVYRLKSPVVPQYHLVDMNCTTLACDLFLPYEVLPLGRGQIGPLGAGRNPADLGQDLRERASQYGSKLTTGDNLKSPSTTNCN